VTPFLQSLLRWLLQLVGVESAQAEDVVDVGLGSGGGAGVGTASHALVLPDRDFRQWYDVTAGYRQQFSRVIIVRSPAGNNLNRYRVVSAVNAPNVWFKNDPLRHIRRAYPMVVTVDVIQATTPAALRQVLEARVRANLRYGEANNMDSRFVLDWPLDTYKLHIKQTFNTDLPDGRGLEGVILEATAGTVVRSATAGEVVGVVPAESGSDYGNYVQVKIVADDGKTYYVTYAWLHGEISVGQGQTIKVGDIIGKTATDGLKLVVQETGKDTGTRFTMPGAIDPTLLFYINDFTLYTTADTLNIRSGRGTEYDVVGKMRPGETAKAVEAHGTTILKSQTTPEQKDWINLDTATGITGFAAAWFVEARLPRNRPPVTTLNGVNLDIFHRLGKPDASRLGNMEVVRLLYNVSMGTGNQNLDQAHAQYAPYIEKMAQSGKKVLLVYTHQTFGEGAGYNWNEMNDDRWRELTARFKDFVMRIADKYKDWGVIAAHQVWNEQDAHHGAIASVPLSPQIYGHMMAETIKAIRSVDAKTPIISGGHTGGPQKGSQYARNTLAAMPPNIRPDGLAFHPYGRSMPGSKYGIFGPMSEEIDAYWPLMQKPLWITEWGILDQPGESPADIRTYALDVMKFFQTEHPEKVAATIWYAWAETMHNGYGLVNENDQPKEPLFSEYVNFGK